MLSKGAEAGYATPGHIWGTQSFVPQMRQESVFCDRDERDERAALIRQPVRVSLSDYIGEEAKNETCGTTDAVSRLRLSYVVDGKPNPLRWPELQRLRPDY